MAEQENVCPQAWGGRGAGLARELRRLAARPPPGVKLLLQDDNMTEITALIDGPEETPYVGGVFRVKFSLESFPAAAPRATFETRIFHPNVSACGRVCVSTLAREWSPELGLAHALSSVRCLLLAPNPHSALNDEAAALLRDHYELYAQRARLYTEIHARPDLQAHGAGATSSTTTIGADPEPEPTGQTAADPASAPAPPKRPRGEGTAAGASSSRAKERRRILKRL